MGSIYDPLKSRLIYPREPLYASYPIPPSDELVETLKKHLRSATKVKCYKNDIFPDSYFVEYRVLPAIIEAEEKAILSEILNWAERNEYDVELLEEAKVREACDKIKPWKPTGGCCGKCYYPISSSFDYCPHCGTKIDWRK